MFIRFTYFSSSQISLKQGQEKMWKKPPKKTDACFLRHIYLLKPFYQTE